MSMRGSVGGGGGERHTFFVTSYKCSASKTTGAFRVPLGGTEPKKKMTGNNVLCKIGASWWRKTSSSHPQDLGMVPVSVFFFSQNLRRASGLSFLHRSPAPDIDLYHIIYLLSYLLII